MAKYNGRPDSMCICDDDNQFFIQLWVICQCVMAQIFANVNSIC